MGTFTVKSFGMLAEKLPASEFTFPYHSSSKKLLEELKNEFPELRSSSFSLAVNQQIVQEDVPLKGDEEIALLPPFSGG